MYQNYHIIKEEESSDLVELSINVEDSSAVTKDALKECIFSISDETNDSIDLYFVSPIVEPFYTMQEEGWGILSCRFTVDSGKICACSLFEENLIKNGNLISGEYFSDEQEANGDLVAIIRDVINEEDDTDCTKTITTRVEGDQRWIEIQGKEYKVIGYHTQLLTPYFPFESLDEDTTFQMIAIHFNKPITSSVYNEIKEHFESTFGSAITVPDLEIPEPENYYLYNTIILISILIAILAAINFAVLYKYILSKRTKTLAVFRICGCTKAKVLRMFLSECMKIAIPLFAATTLIYDKLVLPKLGQHFEHIESAYSIKLYLLIFRIYIAATLIVLMIMISSFLGKTIYESREDK